MSTTVFATAQYEDRSVTGGKIALATILNENVSATADITRTKILNTAVTEGDGGTITGTINIGSGTFILPQGTTLPTTGLVEGQIFWKTDTNQLFVFDGTIFQDAGGAHAFGGAEHIADTLANVNSKISDATLDDVSAARTPLAHAASHSNAGSDEITVENLGTASTNTTFALKPDGAGGVTFAATTVNTLAQILVVGNSTGGTDIQFSGTDKLLGSLGGAILEFSDVVSAVNFLRLINAPTGSGPIIEPAAGGDTNINLEIKGKGTGDLLLQLSGNNVGIGTPNPLEALYFVGIGRGIGAANNEGQAARWSLTTGSSGPVFKTISNTPIEFNTFGLARMTIKGTGQIGIGTPNPATSAVLELASTTGAFLPTRLTTAQRDALTVIDGMIIYNSTLGELQVRESGIWVSPSIVSVHALGGATHSADTLANLNTKISDATLDDSSASRPAQAHALGGAEHTADTLANLNTKVSDATLDDSASARTPTAHESTHISGGSDPFISTDVLEAAVKRIQTSTGPTILTMGAIAEAEVLTRSGSTLIGTPRIAESLFLKVRNETGSSIAIGKLVAAVGFSVAEGRVLVDIADKDDSTKRPSIGITTEVIANNSNTDILLVIGTITNLDTSSFSINDQLLLGDDGNFSRPPPDIDPFTGEMQLVGSVTRVSATLGSVFVTLASGLLPMTAAQFFATKETTPTGGVSGGNVTRAAGLNVDVAAGTGFVNDGTDVFRVTWSAVANLLLTASSTNFIFVNKNGVVQDSVSLPSLDTNILLGDAITDASSIILLANHQSLLTQRAAKVHVYTEDVIGNVVVSGIVTTKDAIALRLQVDTGTFYTRDFRVTVPATDPITFTYWFRDGSGGFTRVVGSTLIDKDNWDDGTGVLNSLIAGEWKKDLLFVVFTGTGLVEYHVFYGQEVFTSQSEAEAGNLPAAASDVIANGIRSGGIVIEGAATAIASVVDVRPFIGQLAPGTTAVSDHGLLSGLSDDDHPIYLPTDGTRAMAGTLDMGTNPITNVGNIDGVDVSSHASRHSNAGADEVTVENLGTASTDTSLVLKPDGSGGLVFGSVAGNVNTVTTTDATVTTIATIAIPDNTVVLFKVDITGRRTDAADRAGYMRNAVVYREAAGSATLQGTVDTPLTRESSAPWDATIGVAGNNAIITVKGNAGHTINWKSTHTTQEIA